MIVNSEQETISV